MGYNPVTQLPEIHDALLGSVNDWRDQRAELFDNEARTGRLDHDAIAGSDDDAADLLPEVADRFTHTLNIAKGAADALLSVVFCTNESFTCDEAEAFAELIRMTHGGQKASEFIDWHAAHDEPGDQHYRGGEG